MNKRYYDIRDTIAESPNTHIFYIVGQGGVGKTYSVKKLCLQDFFEEEKRFIYVRRWTTEIQTLQSVFLDIEDDDEVIEFWNNSKYAEKYDKFHIMPRGEWFYLVGEKNDTKIEWIKRVGRIVALSKSTAFKGGTYPNFKTIFQDEAITRDGYVDGMDEADHMQQIIDTVSRSNADCRVILCGNPDANIEASPYFQHLRLDYTRLQPNTTYYYDTKKASGKILARNECFIKLSGYETKNTGESYLNENTSNIWHTPVGEVRLTGEVLTKKFPQIETIGAKHIRPAFKMILETPVYAVEEYRKKLHIYFGYWVTETDRNDECVMVVLKNDIDTLRRQVDDDRIIYGRYDALDVRARPYKQVYRYNIPHGTEYAELHEIIASVNDNRFLITDDNNAATLYEEIANDS